MTEFFVPIELPSLNRLLNMHHMTRHKTNKRIGGYTKLFLRQSKYTLPCEVNLTRHGPRKLDEINLYGSFKHTQDVIADHLIPGKPMGHSDNDPRLTWKFEQVKDTRKGFMVKIDSNVHL